MQPGPVTHIVSTIFESLTDESIVFDVVSSGQRCYNKVLVACEAKRQGEIEAVDVGVLLMDQLHSA